MRKILFILAAALLSSAAASAQHLITSQVSERYQLEALGASANMRYVVGMNVATYAGFIWDTQTGKIVEGDGDYAAYDFRCISNQSVAYGSISVEDMVVFQAATISADGRSSIIENEMSAMYACTPDGSIAVGCTLDPDMWWPTACIWQNGVRTALPVPSKAECGIDHDGASALFVNADGSVIAGYLQDGMSSRPAIIWRRQADGSYQPDVISRDIWEPRYGMGKTYLRFEILGISPNGKWLCISAQKEAGDDMPTPEFMVRMNLETGEIIESETPQIEYFNPEKDNCYPTSVADDGTCVGSTKDEIDFQAGVIWRAEEKTPRLLADVFPSITQFAHYDGFQHHPIVISGDAQHIVGYGCPVTFVGGEPDYDFVSYRFDVSGTDGIEVPTANRTQSGEVFNLSGQRVTSNYRGIQIQNGRKVLR